MKDEIIVRRPQNLTELDQILLENGNSWTFVAGGTDLLVQKQVWQRATHVIDLTSVTELHQQVEVLPDKVRIGAAVPYTKIIKHPFIKENFPILCEACRQIGSIQIQNRGTIGGNIANASPAGDTLPVLSALDAEVLLGPRQNGTFTHFKPSEIMAGPGQTRLKQNQYIAFVELPLPAKEGQFWAFRKIGQRQAMAISKLSLAVLGWMDDLLTIKEIRIATGSVAPVIQRHAKTEALLNGQTLTEALIEKAAEALKNEISPISDIRSNATYRRETTANVLKDVLYELLMEKKK
ncbi:MAG: xanthine dehydrogenase family protein subunit M [Caldisericaceae bacterium]|nr:xanthine dehydrogenase family protein subunit M [Caldisericaceae bacterium]